MKRSAVLVVQADPEERERVGTWLEEAGFDVLTCPGPSGPDYTCVGSREGTCPLVAEADIVVLDMALESETVMEGTAADELLELYLMSDKPIVVLGSHGRRIDPYADELVVRLERHPPREVLIDVARTVAPGKPRPRRLERSGGEQAL